MQILYITGLVLASFCLVSSYGPPPTKNKHRTTTTTVAPIPEGNSIYSPEGDLNKPSGCGGSDSECKIPSQYPKGEQGQSGTGYSPGTSPSGSFWWQGPNSPFNPDKFPSSNQPQKPFQNLPGGQNQPGPTYPGINQPGSNYPGNTQTGSNNPQNPFLNPQGGHQPGSTYPGINQPGSNYPGNTPAGSNQPQNQLGGQNQPGSTYPGLNQPGSNQPQNPLGGQNQPGSTYPGLNQPGSNYPGPNYPGSSQPSPPHTSSNPSVPSHPGSTLPNQPKPIDVSKNPFLSSALGVNKPSGSPNPSGPVQPPSSGSPQGYPQQPQNPSGQHYPGQTTHFPGGQPAPQYQGGPINSQSPISNQGQPQNPSVPIGQPQFPAVTPGGPSHEGKPNQFGTSPSQYPAPSPGQPQYPQYGSGPNNIPSGNKFPPPFPGSSAPAGQSCNSPNHLCVPKSACSQGVLKENGVPGRAGVCNIATEACCKIPTSPAAGSYAPPNVGYGNGQTPGTNGIPIGGSIYDKPGQVTSPSPIRPYTGPLNTTPYPGCPAALKCVPISYCTAEGVMVNSPVYLTREQEENRVPLTDCMNEETKAIGKCCRDPNYKDPWPGGMMMPKNPDNNGGFDDGQYHPPEQQASNSFSHEAGIYYNVVSTSPKGHTIKKPIVRYKRSPHHPNQYNGPLNNEIPRSCAAALKCVSISLCTYEGVMSNTPVTLTKEEEDNRIPLSDCINPDTNAVGKCCRDPNYKDPWPGGMMAQKTSHPLPPTQSSGQFQQPSQTTCTNSATCPTQQQYSLPQSAGNSYQTPQLSPQTQQQYSVAQPAANQYQYPQQTAQRQTQQQYSVAQPAVNRYQYPQLTAPPQTQQQYSVAQPAANRYRYPQQTAQRQYSVAQPAVNRYQYPELTAPPQPQPQRQYSAAQPAVNSYQYPQLTAPPQTQQQYSAPQQTATGQQYSQPTAPRQTQQQYSAPQQIATGQQYSQPTAPRQTQQQYSAPQQAATGYHYPQPAAPSQTQQQYSAPQSSVNQYHQPQQKVSQSWKPYNGPYNLAIPRECAAGLKCVPKIQCNFLGFMTDKPNYLSPNQEESRVPLSDCKNPDTDVVGKCCRDPNYKDPWPNGMMMTVSHVHH